MRLKNAVDRDRLLDLLTGTYSIPEAYRHVVKQAIQENAQPPGRLTESTLEAMVSTPQSPLDTIAHLGTGIAQWQGRLAEWLVCLEYNSLKNKTHILTIVNPDPTSRADLLHIIKMDHGFCCVPGPDVKTGTEERMVEAFIKVCHEKHDIPMVDPFGILTNPRLIRKMRPSLREQFDRCLEEFPRKRPIPTSFGKLDAMRAAKDLLDHLAYGIRPETRGHHPGIRSPRDRDELRLLKAHIVDQAQRWPATPRTWDRFRHTPMKNQVPGTSEAERVPDEASRRVQNGARLHHGSDRISHDGSQPVKDPALPTKAAPSSKSLFERLLDFGDKVIAYGREHPEEVLDRLGSAFDTARSVRESFKEAGAPHQAAAPDRPDSPALQPAPSPVQSESLLAAEMPSTPEHRASPTPHVVREYTRYADSPKPQHIASYPRGGRKDPS